MKVIFWTALDVYKRQDKGRLYEWKMSGIIAGDIGVIVGQIRADQFAVNPFKVIVDVYKRQIISCISVK